MLEEVMFAPSTGVAHHRVGVLPEPGFEIIQGGIPTVTRILIKDNEATGAASSNRDISIWMVGPPSIDFLGIRGGIFETMWSERVLSGVAVRSSTTSAAAISHSIAGEDRPASRGIGTGRCMQGIVDGVVR